LLNGKDMKGSGFAGTSFVSYSTLNLGKKPCG
jgi:hypothetical protein